MKIKPNSKYGGVLLELRPKELQMPEQTLSPTPALKLQKILVAVDFSECLEKALQYAIAFAKQFRSELILLHVIEPYSLLPEMMPYDFGSINDRKAELEILCALILPPVRSRAQLRIGTPHTEIANAAKDFEADLIILSTHGRKGLSRMVLGSTSEKVVRYASCPVLIVREAEHECILGFGTVSESKPTGRYSWITRSG